jgi:hypothetical protein
MFANSQLCSVYSISWFVPVRYGLRFANFIPSQQYAPLPLAKSGEYITQVTAIGPLGLEFIHSEDDPRNQSGSDCIMLLTSPFLTAAI